MMQHGGRAVACRLVTSLHYGKSECEHYDGYGIVLALRFTVVGQTGNESRLHGEKSMETHRK
jgi:hypothetical protein